METLQAKNTFPEMYRAFADGELSVCMERFGGIDEISLIDVLDFNGKPYPDCRSTPIFSRSKSKSMGRPLYGSAVRIISEDGNGRAFPHYPHDPEIFPWGVRGKAENHSFEMLVDNKCVMFRCTYAESARKDFIVSLSKDHLFNGEFSSFKNQRVQDHCEEHYKHAGIPYEPTKPFPNGNAKVTWNLPEFDEGKNALIFDAAIQFQYGKKKLYLVVTSDAPLAFSEPPSLWALSARWNERKDIKVVFGFGDTPEEALLQAKNGCCDYHGLWNRKLDRFTALENAAPKIEIEHLPLAGQFMRASVGYQNSMLIADGIGVRAATHKFGYFAMWDTIYPIRSFLWNGQYETAKKILRYIVEYPYVDNSAWISSHIILTLNDVLAYDDDPELIDACWPYLKKFFEVALKLTNPKSGLVLCHMNAGVDDPAELGLNGLYHSSCINGWWYGACRVIENLAISKQEDTLEKQAHHVIELLEKNYLKSFFAEDAGYLRTGVDQAGKPGGVEIYQNTSTIGLDYVYGQYLMRSVIGRLADYQATRLYHPMGHVAVAWDSEVRCEMWKSVHMNQHLGHECKLARFAGKADEAYRVLKPYLDAFGQYKVAIETFNYAGCDGNASQTANWQTFSATAAGQAIQYGLAGIGRHCGGLHYIPAYDEHEINIDNLKSGSSIFSIRISGSGKYVGKMTLNGTELNGTMQIPFDLITSGKVEWKIERSNRPFSGPVLLSAFDMPVSALVCGGKSLEFTLGKTTHVPILLQCPLEPRVKINGEPVMGEWNAEESVFWMDRKWNQDDRISICCKV